MDILTKLRKENERLKRQVSYDEEVSKLKSENRSIKFGQNKAVRVLKAVGGGFGIMGRGLASGLQGIQNVRESQNFGPKKTKRVRKVRSSSLSLNNTFFS